MSSKRKTLGNPFSALVTDVGSNDDDDDEEEEVDDRPAKGVVTVGAYRVS